MAVPTGSGTETLHSHMFADVDAPQTLIYGVQHHVYTVLSVIIHCNALDATNFPQFCQVLFDPQRDYNNRQIILKMFEDELIGQIERLSDLTQAALDENAQNALVDILTKSGFSDIKIDPFVDDNGDVLGIKVDANAS